MLKIINAETKEEISLIRELFLEYAKSLHFDLCFQSFDEELANLPGAYAPPSGVLFIAYWNNEAAGCIALRKLENKICEMKRLYVKKNFRGKNIGKVLTDELIAKAVQLGYEKMRLDTVPSMQTAQKLYRELGFYEIPPYRENPVEGAICMELDLKREITA